MLLPYNTKIEFKVIAPSAPLDSSRPNMGVTPGGTVRCQVVAVGAPGVSSLSDFQADAGKWPFQVGAAFWCEPSGVRVISEKAPGTQNIPRYFVDREFVIAVEPL